MNTARTWNEIKKMRLDELGTLTEASLQVGAPYPAAKSTPRIILPLPNRLHWWLSRIFAQA